MKDILKFINKWLIIISILLSIGFILNKYTTHRYTFYHDMSPKMMVDTLTGKIYSVDNYGNIQQITRYR
jgi:hypothetical protein